MNTFKTIEVINTYHRFWFTPYTLFKIVSDAGYKISKLGYFEHSRLSQRELLKKYPAFRSTLVIRIEL